MSLFGPNYSTVQQQIDILRSGDEVGKKRVMEPKNIEDVKRFIAEKKGQPGWEAQEASFQEWENLVANFAADKSRVTMATGVRIESQKQGLIEVIMQKGAVIITEAGKATNVLIPQNERVIIIPNSVKRIDIGGAYRDVIQVKRPNGDVVYIQTLDLPPQGISNGAPIVIGALGPSREILNPQEFKARLDAQLKYPATGPDLLADMEVLRSITDPVGRMYAINWIVGNIVKDGFQITNIGGKLDIAPIDEKNGIKKGQAAELERALLTSIQIGAVTGAEISQSILIGSGDKWPRYLNSTARGAQVSTEGYTQFILRSYEITGRTPQEVIQRVKVHKTITPSEKAYLLSSLQGGMREVNLSQTINTYNTGVQAGIDLFSNQTYQAIAKVTGGTVPKTQQEARRMAEQVVTNPAAATDGDGKPISWLLGGIAAIFALGYSKGEGFSFWSGLKRAFIGVIAVVGGCAVGKEWKKELGFDLCDEAKKMMKDAFGKGKEVVQEGTAKAKKAIKGATEGGARTPRKGSDSADIDPEKKNDKAQTKVEDLKNLTGSQKLATEKVENDEDLKKTFEKANPGKGEYINFIHQELSSITLDKLITDDEASIFAPGGKLHSSISGKLGKLTPNTLKKVLRVYLGSSARFSEVQEDKNPGQKEKGALVSELQKHGVSADQFTTTDLKKAISSLYTDSSAEAEKKSQEVMKKIAAYNVVYDGEVLPKDNMDVKIEEYEEGGFVAEVNIKVAKKIDDNANKINPITIEFDQDGKLQTTELGITGSGTFLWKEIEKTTLCALKQEGNNIVLTKKEA